MKKFLLNDNNIIALIILNSILILYISFLKTEPALWLVGLDSLFIFVFILEAGAKMDEYGMKGYFKSKSNIFDFLLVVISFIGIVLSLNVGYVLMFRIIRVFRCLRLYKTIPGYSDLAKNFKMGLKASLGIISALFIGFIVVGVSLCYLYKDVSPEYFGTPFDAVYTVFTLFSVENWPTITDEVTASLSPFWEVMTKLCFGTIVFVGGILGIAFLTGHFSDAFSQDNNDEVLEEIRKLREEIKELKADK